MPAEPVPVHLNKALAGLAVNPALPPDLVRRMVGYRRGFGEVARRPDLTDDMITEIIDTDHEWQVHKLALNQGLPSVFRMRLAEHRDPSVRRALATGGQNAPTEMFERLISDPDPRVRTRLAQRDDLPTDLLARLVTDPDPDVRVTLAKWWTQAPDEVRRLLLTDPVDKVRAAACSTYYARRPHPVPPPDLILALLADPVTRAGVIRHATLDPAAVAQLAEDPNALVRAEIASHPGLPPHLRDALANDPDASVKVRIFARPDTPEPTRARIHAEVHRAVPLDGMPDPDDDDAVLDQWITSANAALELRWLRLAWVTADPLPHVDSAYVCYRASAAANEALPPEVVAKLLNDEDNNVRLTMAKHAPHLVDLDAAERLDRTYRPDKRTLRRPADDFTFPPETLRRFATDPEPRMRCLAPRDPDLPTELAERLAHDPDASVRGTVAPHPNLPTSILIALLADQNEWVAETAAASPRLPVAQMVRLLTLGGL